MTLQLNTIVAVRIAVELTLRDPEAGRALLAESAAELVRHDRSDARAALLVARAAATAARANPTPERIEAVRVAIRTALRGAAAADIRADDLGYNPYRERGKFAPGPRKARPKATFDATSHQKLIAAHKDLEAHHRAEARRLASELRALKEQAKSAQPRSAERKALKGQQTGLTAQRNEHRTKANDARATRIEAGKELTGKRAEFKAEQLAGRAKRVVEVEAPAKNPKRVAAAKLAAAASLERRREIHSAVASNLPHELQATWAKEGHKFMQQEAPRIRGEKDRINAASKLSEAFAEQYGHGSETARGYEGDKYYRRAEIEAQHAESWANEQERKYYAAAMRDEQHRQLEQPEHDDVPF